MRRLLVIMATLSMFLIAPAAFAEDCFVSGELTGKVVHLRTEQAIASIDDGRSTWHVAQGNVEDFHNLFRLGHRVQVCRTWAGIVLKNRNNGYSVAVFQR